MRRALSIDELSGGSSHPNVSRDLNNLALLLQDDGRMVEAESLLRRALAIAEDGFGVDHPTVAARANNLAGLLEATGRLAEAEPLRRLALAIDETSFGSNHPLVAIRLNNLAGLLAKTGRFTEANLMMRPQIEILVSFWQTAGHAHEHFQVALRNYVEFLKSVGHTKARIDRRLREVLAPIADIPARQPPPV